NGMRCSKIPLYFCIAFILFFYVQVWMLGYRMSKRILDDPREEQLSLSESTSTSSIFVYRAYYDDRAAKNTIRILAISKCLSPNTRLTMKINGVSSPLHFQPVEGGCPWAWAKKCAWNAYEFQSIKIYDSPEAIEICINDERSVTVQVERREPVTKDTIQALLSIIYLIMSV
ncbi:hypothetical protein PFISCL1PPCAC_12833, partial [Pristionchus fissidentatus]